MFHKDNCIMKKKKKRKERRKISLSTKNRAQKRQEKLHVSGHKKTVLILTLKCHKKCKRFEIQKSCLNFSMKAYQKNMHISEYEKSPLILTQKHKSDRDEEILRAVAGRHLLRAERLGRSYDGNT